MSNQPELAAIIINAGNPYDAKSYSKYSKEDLHLMMNVSY